MDKTNTPAGQTEPPWVFGYGSLIWRPGFDFSERSRALLRGVHRCLCVYSHRHRGTAEQPGLVFGLAPGGSCAGMAYRVTADAWADVLAYLRDREQVTGVYRETYRPIVLEDGRAVRALAFLADQKHDQYAGRLDMDRQLALIRKAVGFSGPNSDYVVNTAAHLEKLGVGDRRLNELVRRLSR